ncbi:hypothetical protein C4577_02870 [Candidatus Parcubacteria bacterium]|nr:MAG: hypothetical protein C4577_02870 [Candidatus Parcubacteria bacterium]
MTTAIKAPKITVVKSEVRKRTYHKLNIKDYHKCARFYWWFEGETVLDHLVNRKFEPYKEIRKQVLGSILKDLGVTNISKIRWSQYAGCSCPCSPGFILDNALAMIDGQPESKFDVFCTLKMEMDE